MGACWQISEETSQRAGNSLHLCPQLGMVMTELALAAN
jgi:hypothetical protein